MSTGTEIKNEQSTQPVQSTKPSTAVATKTTREVDQSTSKSTDAGTPDTPLDSQAANLSSASRIEALFPTDPADAHHPLKRLEHRMEDDWAATKQEWKVELTRDKEELIADTHRDVAKAKETVQALKHPAELREVLDEKADHVGRDAREVAEAVTHPKETLENAGYHLRDKVQRVAQETELIGQDLCGPIDKQRLPLSMKIYGWLCVLAGLIVFGATVKAVVDSVGMFQHGEMATLGTSTIVVTFVHLAVIGLLAVTFFVFGTRLLYNQRKFAAYLAYAIYLLIAAGAACSLMLEGVTITICFYIAIFALTVAVQSYLDPSLRDERKLHRLLKAREDLAEAEAGTLGRDPEGKGYITLNFFNLFWIFVVCSILGLLMEDIVHITLVDPGHWQDRAGLLFGPFSPIYGCGAVLMTIFLNRLHKRNLVLIFLLSAIIGGAFEYFTSWFMQYTYGAVAWNYTGQFLSIGGRTCGWAMACWGLLGCVWVKLLLPLLLHVINLVPWNWRYTLTTVAALFMLVDAVMSLEALDCWYERLSDDPIETPIQRFYDQYFDNEFMANRFQSMTINPDDAVRHGKTNAEVVGAASSSGTAVGDVSAAKVSKAHT